MRHCAGQKKGFWQYLNTILVVAEGFDDGEGIKRTGIWSFCINQASDLVSWRVVRTRLSYERPRAPDKPKYEPLARPPRQGHSLMGRNDPGSL